MYINNVSYLFLEVYILEVLPKIFFQGQGQRYRLKELL